MIIHSLIYSGREALVYIFVPVQAAYFLYIMLPSFSVHDALAQLRFRPYLTRHIDKLSPDSLRSINTQIFCTSTGGIVQPSVHVEMPVTAETVTGRNSS